MIKPIQKENNDKLKLSCQPNDKLKFEAQDKTVARPHRTVLKTIELVVL